MRLTLLLTVVLLTVFMSVHVIAGNAAAGPVPVAVNAVDEVPCFSDISGHWAEDYICQAAAKGYLKGYGNGTFRPSRSLTRAQFAAIMVRLWRLDQDTSQQEIEAEAVNKYFNDVSPTDWYARDVMLATKAGIFQGDSYGFRPNDPILREEVAICLARALQKKAGFMLVGMAAATVPVDLELVSPGARPYVLKVWELGLMQGNEKGEFGPARKLTRAEMAVLISRIERLFSQ
ncbi:MAG: S-layer homology domain-containing protein [Bacillota bacterium]|uniref:S-layer homology domain-containing protein n=1 Tax=Desulfurispora thermophila TaxID=265470 RepID=UPI00036D50AD|nr:S-layer homology domain-containing protein [Desulfurispora thermophila]